LIDGVVTKQYAEDDHMELEFEETPDVMTITGKVARELTEQISHDS
jgi:hypothetical protein